MIDTNDFLLAQMLRYLIPLLLLSQVLYSESFQVQLKDLGPVLNTYCFECHDETAKGGLDLDELGLDLSQAANLDKWVSIFDQVESGVMPPEDKKQPGVKEKASFLKSLKASLISAHQTSKGTVLRRLNRREYENTLNDIFGTNLDLAGRFPEDGRYHEFDTVGEALSISMSQMQNYLESIDLVLETAIAKTTEKPKSSIQRYRYQDVKGNQQFYGKHWLESADGATVFFLRRGYPTGMLKNASIRQAGYYKIRVKGYAMQTDRPIPVSIGAATYQRGAMPVTFAYEDMPVGNENKTHVLEVETWIDRNYMIQVEPWGLIDPRNELKKNIKGYKGPGMAIQYIEVEGPLIDEFPTRGHALLFSELKRSEIPPRNPKDKLKTWYKPKFQIEGSPSEQVIRKTLLNIANKAFRRKVDVSEMQSYLELYQAELEAGFSQEEALRSAVAALFCSHDFLYFNETPGKLNQTALANRLSYFLNRTLPDERLMGLALANKLESRVLLQETRRLMHEPHFERFIVDFCDSWLGLRDMDFTNPDKVLFPEFDAYLKHSMIYETRLFLKELIKNNHSVTSMVKTDFAMLNQRLAEHYEIEGVKGAKLKTTKLPPKSVRGGLITQGSILKVSANGTNTSPVVRGIWLLERIMGLETRPPPPGVPGVEPDIRGASTLREILDQHRDKDSCRSCHQQIDPPGFALENFNPVGGWRDHFRSLGEGEKVHELTHGRKVRYKKGLVVDASSILPNGQRFEGFQDFRDDLAGQKELLAKAFVKKLLIFGTGREMGFSDRQQIKAIVKKAAPNYGMRDLLFEVIQSEIFQSK